MDLGLYKKCLLVQNIAVKNWVLDKTIRQSRVWARQKKFTEILLGTTEKFVAAELL